MQSLSVSALWSQKFRRKFYDVIYSKYYDFLISIIMVLIQLISVSYMSTLLSGMHHFTAIIIFIFDRLFMGCDVLQNRGALSSYGFIAESSKGKWYQSQVWRCDMIAGC